MTKNYDSAETFLLSGSTISSLKGITSYKTKKRTWLSFLTVFVALFSFIFTQAQSTANYAFSTNTTGSLALDANGNSVDMSSGTTQLVAADIDDTSSSGTSIGFNFPFFGSQFTQFYATSNGVVQLGNSAPSSTLYVLSGGSVASPRLGAFVADLRTGTLGKVHYKVVGSAPNRTLVIEFLNMSLTYVASPGSNDGTYQVRLYETTGSIEYIYGSMFRNSSTTSNAAIYAGFSVGSLVNTTASITTATNTVSNGATFNLNSYTNSANIPNLHSTVDGSRRVYSFTPLSIVSGDVTNLTFNTITTNGMTLNWTDNATNEFGFTVTRATDAAFTQNVASFAVASTTSAGVGTDYTSIQTGLSSGTNYFYKVVANVEAGQSTGITGNQSTLNATTYYWTGATGGNWDLFSNWNTSSNGTGSNPTAWTNSDIHIIDGAGTTAGGPLSIIVDKASFTVGQIKVIDNTDLTLSSNATTTRTITISGGPNEDFILDTGSTLNLTSATNAVAFAFTGSGNTGTLSGTYIASGSTSNNISTTGGTGTLFTVTSTGNITSNLNSSSACITGNATNLIFQNGSNYTHSNSTTVNYIPTATWQANATATLNGNTSGTTLTSGSTSLGNLIVNNTLSTGTLSAFTSNSRIIQGNLTVNSTGTGRFRAITSGVLQINGDLIINGGIFEIGSSSSGGVIVKGNTLVASGGIIDLNQSTLQNEGNMINNGSVLSSETTTANSRLNFLGTSTAQTLSGSGTFTGRVSSLGVANPMGLTISTTVLVQRVNLFYGLVTGSSNITIGTGLALGAAVQIGQASNPNSGGNFDVSPIYNLGTGSYTILYLSETTPRTTGFEIPPSRIVNNITLDNTNGLTIAGGVIEVLNTLTLTNGIVSTTSANHISHGSATTAGTLTGGSTNSFIDGPIVRTINDANTASNYVLYPVGKAGVYSPIWLAPTTTSASKFKAEAFNSNSGTEDASIIGLSTNRRWEAIPTTGTFTDINVRLADANLVSTNIPVHAVTANGAYSSAFGSIATFTAGTPNTVQSNFSLPSANYNGFLSYANSNTCSGTPTPGNTISSSNSICLGESITLSLQNITTGSGVTYQWKSSTDGITYTAISGAINPTLTISPTQAEFYICEVTCSAGPTSGSSLPFQIIFTNNITSTIPNTRCGTGSVDLMATGNTGTTINWYSDSVGGSPLAIGNTFTTPSINTTTTYYAAATTSSSGNITLGAGATNSSSTAASFFPGSWGGAKTQYIIRASELIQAGITAGPITNLGFEPTNSGQTYQGFYVNVGHTTLNTAPTSTFVPNTNLTLVYAGSEANDGYTPIANTINNLVFGTGTGTSNSFIWDGASNIVISISWSRVPSASTSTSTTMKVDNVGFVSSAYRQRDNVTPTAMLDETSVNSTSSNRPKFTINGQLLCSSPRVAIVASVTTPPNLSLSLPNVTICESDTSATITLTSSVGDYNTYTWSPSSGVTGNESTGWQFNPTVSTLYTLTASQTSGSLCSTTTTFNVIVNPLPTSLIITPTSTSTCIDTIQSLVTSGGIIGVEGKVGSGTSTNTTSTPFKGYWGGSKTQALYTASELTALGMVAGQNINTIGFVALSGTPNLLNNFTINAGFVSNSTLGTDFISGATNVVLSPASYTPSSGSGNLDFTMTTPLNWDGVSNLLIETCFNNNNGGGAIANSISVESSTVVSGLNLYRSQDNTADVCSNTTLPSVSTNRPNLRISTIESTLITWSPVNDLYTDAAATIAYVANTNAPTVYYKSSIANTNTYTATATTAFNCFVNTTASITTLDCGIPYVNLQFPGTATIETCNTQTFYAQVYKAGVTEAAGQGSGITAWIGTNTTNTDPATWPETSWQLATFNVQFGNNDEYQATFGPMAAGTYYVASRFVFTPGNYVYGGYTPTGGGIWDGTNNISAVLTVNDVTAPTASSQSFCNSATVADLVATGTALQWYTASTGGTSLTSTTPLVSGDYYVSQTINSCESIRTMVSVTINVTSAPTASSQSFCNSATVGDLVATGTALQWYAASTGGTALASTTPLVSGDYYVSQTLNSCESSRTMVSVTVNVTSAPTASSQSFCNGATVADLVAAGTALQWYTMSTGGTALADTTTLVSGDYYVSQTLNSCESPRTLVTVSITTVPTPTGNALQTVTETNASDATIEDLVVSGTGIIWYPSSADAAAGTNAIVAGTQLISGATYYAVSVVGPCSSTPLAVTVTVVLETKSFDVKGLKYYPNPVLDVFSVNYSQNITSIEIYDLSGRKVKGNKVNNTEASIDMSELAASVYVVKVFAEGQSTEFKIIKK
jgi:hypothetical protein